MVTKTLLSAARKTAHISCDGMSQPECPSSSSPSIPGAAWHRGNSQRHLLADLDVAHGARESRGHAGGGRRERAVDVGGPAWAVLGYPAVPGSLSPPLPRGGLVAWAPVAPVAP